MIPPHLFYQIYLSFLEQNDCTPPKCGELSEDTDSAHTEVEDPSDSAAKSALDLPRDKVGVPYTDFKYLISQYIFSTWQDDWNGAIMNKLHSVKPVLGNWQSSYRRCRKDEVVLCRARIGHTHWTHSLKCVS